MLISKEVDMRWSSSNKKYYIEKGYLYTKMKDIFKVKIDDLPKGSVVLVKVKCDGEDCNCIKDVIWQNYLKYIKNNGKYYCIDCARKLFAKKNTIKTRLKNGKSFEQWCIDNNRQDILDRWDYELNKCKPNEITYSSGNGYYFKCPRKIHKSEIKYINYIVKGSKGVSNCKKCGSFAQWSIDNLDEDFLEKYWDYEKNMTDPWKIGYGSNKYIWLKCQEKEYHGSYRIACNSFIAGYRCTYCAGIKTIHKLDSLGTLYPKSLELWSDKNTVTPFEFAPFSNKKAYWKCSEGIHKDYKRSIVDSNYADFNCPSCRYFKGEKAIEIYLLFNKIKYTLQKKYNNLFGIHNGKLSYDFYLPQYNLLIEYQGEQHEKPVDFSGLGMKRAKEKFKTQQEHDKRKREYAKK